ncbi:TniQ family protein [Herbaspirillum camelliae]|uniref:TniQ family protein n=1 Tax=Herbaspirillum camelliae TaxID=1892903 RepID=UPI000949EA2F|nr:TniQ family protein [Herbaspirillum camelliae]
MLTFSLPLADDEHYFSYFSSLYLRSGTNSPRKFLFDLALANRKDSLQPKTIIFANLMFPVPLRGLVGSVISEAEFSPDRLGLLTPLPYYRPFLATTLRERLFESVSSTRPSYLFHGSKDFARIRFCKECRKKAREEYGRDVFLRSHQLPGVYVCWKHLEPLYESAIELAMLSRSSDENAVRCVQNVTEEWIWLAGESRALLNLNHDFVPMEAIEALYHKFGCGILDQWRRKVGLSEAKRFWRQSWSQLVIERYSNELSAGVFNVFHHYSNVGREWCRNLPFEHLLAIRSNFGSVDEFFKKLSEVSREDLARVSFEEKYSPKNKGSFRASINMKRVHRDFLSEVRKLHLEVRCAGGMNFVFELAKSGGIEYEQFESSQPALIDKVSDWRYDMTIMSEENYAFAEKIAEKMRVASISLAFHEIFEYAIAQWRKSGYWRRFFERRNILHPYAVTKVRP